MYMHVHVDGKYGRGVEIDGDRTAAVTIPIHDIFWHAVHISVQKRRPPHTPYVHNVVRAMVECIEPGLDMFHARVHHQLHVAVLQDRETGYFYCVQDGCNRCFDSFEAWKCHYDCGLYIPNTYCKLIVRETGIVSESNHKFRRVAGYHARPNVQHTSQSLCDAKHGPYMYDCVCRKLQRVQDDRQRRRVY